MENFVFESPTKLIFGKDTQKDVGKYVKKYATKILIHYESDGSLIKKLGIYDRVAKSLDENGIKFIELGGVVPNPRIELARIGIQLCKENDIDFILAIGGGSVIDSAKAIALGIKYDGDVWDFYIGKNTPKISSNVGVILTIPGSGSEMSESSIMSSEKLSLKCVCDSELNFPVFSILDPQVCYTIPKRLMACGVADIMCHIMERYFTRVKDIELSNALMESAMRVVVEYGLTILDNPREYNNCAQIMWAATIAHNGMISSGRIADWSSHRIEHELSALYDITHGVGMAIIFPAWMEYVKNEDINIFVRFAQEVFGIKGYDKEELADKGIEKLKEFFNLLGLNSKLSEININDKDFDLMATKALAGAEHLGRFKKLNHQDIVKILKISQ